jgi:capsid protein
MFAAIKRAVGRLFGANEQQPPQQPSQQAIDHVQRLRATYDAARNTDEFKNYWINADQYDADSAHDPAVRLTLISRSRYEIGNNGYADGIAQTYSTDVVGIGPTLRMQSGSEGFNRMVELAWHQWTKAVNLRRKLWCMAHAKHSDGEAFASLSRNPGVKNRVKLDVVLHEAEQIGTPYLQFGQDGYIDGIKFDQFGNPEWYDLLRQHPGATNSRMAFQPPERIPARLMLHWFKLRRPGQHRAVPEMSSTLNTGAAFRRWREAVIASAETAADYTFLMKTEMPPDEAAKVAPFSTMDISKRQMGFLPRGWDPFQPDAKFPSTNHAEFHKTLLNEQARPKSMPLNKAACDSSAYNYASGRLDHQTYYSSLDVDREDANDLVLDQLFEVWFELAVAAYGWLGGNPDVISEAARAHIWDWPKHRVADIESEANANKTKLATGQMFLHQLFADQGWDLADEAEKAASAFGVKVDEIMRRLLEITLPDPSKVPGAGGQSPQPDATKPQVNDAATAMFSKILDRLNGKTNGHSVSA